MGKAKGKWLLALLALAFAAILAAVLCMNFPMAEVHAETAVAKVTAATGETQTYEKLSDAFKAAKVGDTVTLLRNAEITERIVIENKSVVFDLGEYTLTMDEDFSADDSVALRAGTNGILTIKAGTNGTIDAQNAPDYLVPVAAMASGSKVIINGGTIIVNTAYESCVYAGGGGTVVIEDGVFKNLCQKPFAYVQDGSSPALAVNISDSYTDGGAYLTINGGTFVGRNPMLGDTNPGVTSSYMGSDVNIAQLSGGSFAAVGADDPLPEDTEYFYTEKDGEIVVTVYTPEALAAAVAGDETFADNTFTVVRLGAAIEQGITIADGRVLTLDLNGFTLSNTAGSHTITNSGTLTIIDGGENGEVTNTSAGKAVILNNGEMTLAGGKYTRTADHYVIDNNKGNMTIEAGVTVESPSTFSSMIRNGGDNNAVGATPTLTINGGSFSGGLNTIKNDDYGILHINDGSFSNTTQHVILNWSTATIEGGTFTPQNDAYAAVWTGTWYTSANFTQGVTVIEDGIFNGAVTTGIGKDAPQTTAKADYTISGGTFTEPVPAAYLEDGFTLTVGDGTYGVEEADELATVTRGEAVYNFATLAEALTFAEDGDMVTLLADVSENVVIEKSITLDLNGKTISSASGYAVDVKGAESEADKITVSILSTGTLGTIGSESNSVALAVTGFAEVSAENVAMAANVYGIQIGNNSSPYQTVVNISGSSVYGKTFAGVYIMGTTVEDKPVTFTAVGSEIKGYYYGITGNGTHHNTYIELKDSALEGLAGTPDSTDYDEMGYGIYHPQKGILVVDGGSVKGVAGGIEIRSGSLTVKGGAQITATAENFYVSPNGNGTTTVGAAVAVSQHSTNNTIDVVLEDGVFEGVYALYEADVQDPSEGVPATIEISGGTFEGKVESTNVTGFISGGMFKYRPAEDYMDPDFVTELQNGYYVPVESSALRAAQTNAQADVREYVLMLGMKWAEVQALADKGDENAVALVAAYNAIADTTSEKGVAEARLKAMDAADAFAAAQEDAWEQAKADKIAELESWRDENANGLVIPLYIYTAMNSAADEEELNSYFEQAKAEIGDIYAYRNQITAQSEDLQTLKDTLTALNGALTGENNSFDELLANVEEAIGKAQSAIIGTDADSDSLAGIRDYLEKTINAALEGIDDAISGTNGIASELAGISDVLNGFTSKLDTITGALDEETGWIAEAIEKAQGDITSILTALDSLADGTDIEALADSLAQILEDIAAVQGTVDEIEGEVSAVSSVQEAKDEALTDIGEWLNNYLDSIIGGTDEANGGAAVALAFTAETTDGDIYAKLTKVFSEDNAQLVLRYYNEALASIDAATTVSEVTTAVSTFKAQVASVEAAAQNTTNLTGLYVLLVIVLVAVVVVLVIVIVKKNRSAEAAEQPAEEAEQPVPAEEVPAAEPEQPEPAAEENELAAEADDDKEQVVIAANVRSFSEAYVELNEELLDLFNKVKEYALAKDGAAEVKQSNGICIKRNGKQIVKLTVRRGYPVALFFLENEMLKDFRRTTNTNAKLKIRATELVLREAADLEAAYTMVDLSVEQIDKDIENAKERRREARRARRKQKQLEEEAQQQEIAAGSAENGENERP